MLSLQVINSIAVVTQPRRLFLVAFHALTAIVVALSLALSLPSALHASSHTSHAPERRLCCVDRSAWPDRRTAQPEAAERPQVAGGGQQADEKGVGDHCAPSLIHPPSIIAINHRHQSSIQHPIQHHYPSSPSIVTVHRHRPSSPSSLTVQPHRPSSPSIVTIQPYHPSSPSIIMAAINPTPMATVHIGVAQDASPSPPLTKSHLIPVPLRPSISPVRLSPSPTWRGAVSPPTWRVAVSSPPTLDGAQLDPRSDEGVATTLRMPVRIKAGPPSSVPPSYLGHDHGTPLSDIGEEESTPGSKAGRRSSGLAPVQPDSPTQSPVSALSHASRASIQSLSDGSDVGDWESFEPSKMMTGRLAADMARDDDDGDGDGDGIESTRNSIVTSTNGPEADEMAILNAKAERILANARQRLTSMEDNLTKARHSILLGDGALPSVRTSPSMPELHQPAGGLYRSISLASRKTKPLHLVSKTQQQVHARGLSDTISNNKLKALSMAPEARASSAQEYRRRYESPQPPTPTLPRFMRLNGQSPTSSRSVNSPIREDHDESPSTVKTSPESPYTHGLGINTLARETREDISIRYPACPPSPASAPRTVSSASTRSIKEHVTDLKGRITDLQTKTKTDKERRVAYLSRNTPSPFTNSSNPEQWYAGAPEYKEGCSPLNANAGIGWSPSQGSKLNLNPVTPPTQKFLDGENLTSTGETNRFDIRTDVNTPNLAERAALDDAYDSLSNADSIVPESLYEDAAQGFDDQDQVAASEEEQIYLNEVLEESLQDVEADVPDATEDFTIPQEAAERHEDRLDAFDYENMFLHSALGNFAGANYRDSGSSDASSPRSRSQFSSPAPSQQHPANTEILMESLIKLADPDFRVQASGVKFADIDKDLVLSLLRAVGGVCDGVLKAERAGRPDEVTALRSQLDWGRRVLEGEGGRI
ncbi:hypothetical protein DV737_g4412, partial [Chaetothyriales sp. CBS 132003]